MGKGEPPARAGSSARIAATQLGDAQRLAEIIAVQQELISAPNDAAVVGDIVVSRMRTLTGADAAVLELLDGDEMVYAAASGALRPYVGKRLRAAASLSGLAVRTAETLETPEVETDSRVDLDACRSLGIRSMIVAPLLQHDRPIGVLKVAYAQPRAYTGNEVLIVRLLAGLIGHTLGRAQAEAARERAEAALRQSEESFRRAFERLPEGVVIHAGGVVIWANASLMSLLGYPNSSDIVGMPAFDLVHPHDRLMLGERALGGAGSTTIRQSLLCRTGQPVLVEILGVQVAFQNRAATLAVVRDLAEHRRIEDELLRAKDLAEDANRAKSGFLASMSHELRTPLNAIIGFAELLADGCAGVLTPKQQEYVDHVARSGHHLLELVNDILDLAKVEADRVVLERHPQRIEPVVADAIATVRPIASRRGVALNVNVGEDLPELSFDRTRMQQVLHNVLSNAIKFTDAGGSVTLTVARHAAGLSLRVSDTGVGIAPADMQKLFKPFVQVGAQRHGGTGLGLVLTRKLVELHGGRIDLESAFGIGTTLTITLPSVDDSSPAPSGDR